MKLLAVAIVVASGAAHAEPARYIEAGGMVGFGAPALMNAVGTVSAGARLEAAPIWLHGQVETGPAADDQGGGSIAQARGGVETRTCTSRRALCGVIGLDVGGMHGTWTSHENSEQEDVRAVVAVPRVALELGGEHVVVTTTLEVAEMIAGTHTYTYGANDVGTRSMSGQASSGMTESASGLGALELGLGLGYRW
jgi:hypothetical protein